MAQDLRQRKTCGIARLAASQDLRQSEKTKVAIFRKLFVVVKITTLQQFAKNQDPSTRWRKGILLWQICHNRDCAHQSATFPSVRFFFACNIEYCVIITGGSFGSRGSRFKHECQLQAESVCSCSFNISCAHCVGMNPTACESIKTQRRMPIFFSPLLNPRSSAN